MSKKLVQLYGEMRELFGEAYELEVRDTAEAIRALGAIVPGFKAYLLGRADSPFRVSVNDVALDENGLRTPVGAMDTIKIVPLVAGAKGDFGQILMGLVLYAAAAVFYLNSEFGGSVIGDYLVTMGTAMIVGGVAQLLFAPPVNAPNSTDLGKDKETWAFLNPTMTTGQGGFIPVLYGEGMIAGHVVSAGIDAQIWQKGGFGEVCSTDDGVMYGNGDTIPWSWAIDES